MPETFLDGRVHLHSGDCREVLKSLPDASIDAIVTDPPYALTSIVQRFGAEGAAPPKEGVFSRSAAGFMGQKWDTHETAFAAEFWRECLRVLKPGGWVAAFSATRTAHELTGAIAAAGFDVRDNFLEMLAADTHVRLFLESLTDEQLGAFIRCLDDSEFGGWLAWVFGVGFPKTVNVPKAIDKHLGAERVKVKATGAPAYQRRIGNTRPWMNDPEHMVDDDNPATPEAAEWEGWRTGVKPAFEPIVLARRPLEGTVAANVLKYGTGALNIDGCRIGDEALPEARAGAARLGTFERADMATPARKGRYPANVIHDGSPEVVALFPETPGQKGEVAGGERQTTRTVYNSFKAGAAATPRLDEGSAARFFYSAKADGDDRHGLTHPTIKPVDLMRWLVRLVCRKGGVILDPFAGTGTTAEAGYWEGVTTVLVEREAAYQDMIRRRMALVLAGPDEKKRARTDPAPVEETPLFAPLGASACESR